MFPGMVQGGQGASSLSDMMVEQNYQAMRLNYLQEKINCSTCREAENEKILPCGHMFCKGCIDDLFKNRMRGCPTCRRRISKNDVIHIYWGSETGAN